MVTLSFWEENKDLRVTFVFCSEDMVVIVILSRPV